MHIKIAKFVIVIMFLSCFVFLVNAIAWNLRGMFGSLMATCVCSVSLLTCMIIDVIKTNKERREYRD